MAAENAASKIEVHFLISSHFLLLCTPKNWKKVLKIPPLQKCEILCFISALLSARSSWKTHDSLCSYRNFMLVSVQWRPSWIAILLKIMAATFKCLYYKQPLRRDGKLLSIISWSLCFSYLVPSNYHLDDSHSLDLSLINLSFSGCVGLGEGDLHCKYSAQIFQSFLYSNITVRKQQLQSLQLRLWTYCKEMVNWGKTWHSCPR